MADTPDASSEPRTPPSSASEQARIRKERREAKIRAGGSARLDKITGLGGGIPRDPPPQPATAPAHGDPDEVDISQHFYEPNKAGRASTNAPQQQISDDQLRQMMLGFDPSSTPPPGSNPFSGPGLSARGSSAGGPPGADDPMMNLLQQMMGGVPGEGSDGMPAFPGMAIPTVASEPYAYLWRIVHAVFAVGLGLYIAFMTPFTGSKAGREASAMSYLPVEGAASSGLSPASVHFFWIFSTAEVLLQTSRFFVEKGRVQQGTVLGIISGFLPEPYKGYLALVTRYSRIWTTVSADAMTLVFVLGACAWWKSM